MSKELFLRRCCGLDVHQQSVFACVLTPQGDQPVMKVFGTFRNDLVRLRVWLKQLKVTTVAMESTGVYWRPVWNVLEGHGFELLLVNPQQVKALHGRKSDKRDSRRIAEFLHDRRLDASFVPPREIRELRALTRLRLSWLEQRNEVHNQIRDLLETVNIKLSSVASDIMGVTGTRILRAIVNGMESPEQLSWKARGSLRAKEEQLREALKGDFTPGFRWLLGQHLANYDWLTAQIEQIEARIGEQMQPYQRQIEILCSIPGVDRIVAWNLLAELVRGRHGGVSDGGALRQLGRPLSGPKRECGRVQECANQERESIHSAVSESKRLGGVTLQGRLPPCALPSHQGVPRVGQSGGGRSA